MAAPVAPPTIAPIAAPRPPSKARLDARRARLSRERRAPLLLSRAGAFHRARFLGGWLAPLQSAAGLDLVRRAAGFKARGGCSAASRAGTAQERQRWMLEKGEVSRPVVWP